MTDETGDLVVFAAQDASGETFARHRFTDFLIPNEDDADCTLPDPDSFISTPHSNSFLDLNGDCMPDIFLQKTAPVPGEKDKFHNYYEIYT